MIDDNRRGEQWPEGAAGVPADLEYRLGKAESPVRAQVRDARCFRMKNGGAMPLDLLQERVERCIKEQGASKS